MYTQLYFSLLSFHQLSHTPPNLSPAALAMLIFKETTGCRSKRNKRKK